MYSGRGEVEVSPLTSKLFARIVILVKYVFVISHLVGGTSPLSIFFSREVKYE